MEAASDPRAGTSAGISAGATPPETGVGDRSSAPDPRFAEYRTTGDRAIRNALVEDYRWLGLHCVRRFKHKGEPTDDLEQVAMVGLLKAVDRFDPGLGYAFSTYAVPTIVGELRRHFRDRTWARRVPRRTKDNYLAIRNIAEELHPTLGRSPTIPEIAQHAGLSVEDTLEALEAGASYRGVPLNPPGEHDDDDHGEEAERLGVDDPGYVATEARMIVPGLLATLPTDRERQIIKLRFVEDMSQSQIAAKLGISQVHVSRLLRTSLNLMRQRLAFEPRR
jgi:RNA polymerase sigma-B factor